MIGAACISLQPLLLSALMLPATAYVIRGMGPSGYGLWATATTLVGVTALLANLGLRSAFVRSVARAPESAAVAFADQLGARTALSILASGVALGACLLLGYPRMVIACTALGALAVVASGTSASTCRTSARVSAVISY